MIPFTDEECDGFVADVAAAILAGMAPQAYTMLQEIADDGVDESGQPVPLAVEALSRVQMTRAEFAVSEAEALLTTLQRHARVQRELDGSPIDRRAADRTQLYCAHGARLSDPCAECAAGDINGETGADVGAGLRAFREELQGGKVS